MELNKINLNLLLSLYYLLQQRSVTAAAATQFVTQPAMSRNLAILRDMFSDPLLVRVGNEMKLTPRSEALWLQLPPLLNQIEGLLVPSHFEPAGFIGQFNIAATDFLTQQVLPPLVAQLQIDAPGLSLNFHLWHPGMIDSLRQGRLDIAACILEQIPSDMRGTQVGTDHFVCLISEHHPLAETNEPMSLQHYTLHSHIAVSGGGDKIGAVDEALAVIGQKRSLAIRVPFIQSALAMTACSHYILTLPNHMADNATNQYPLVKKNLPAELDISTMHYQIIWHQRLQNDPAHRYLRQRIVDTASITDGQVIS